MAQKRLSLNSGIYVDLRSLSTLHRVVSAGRKFEIERVDVVLPLKTRRPAAITELIAHV